MDHSAVMETQRPIEGMMMEGSAATWCALLSTQHEAWTWGEHGIPDYLEIGTFKGKSASVLASFAASYGNRLTVVDPALDQETKDRLLAITPAIDFIDERSELLPSHNFCRDARRHIGFCHIDGMHTFAAVQEDMRTCEPLLSDFGIMCLDDIFTELYPQVTAAMFDYLYTAPTDLVPFLTGLNKAYLCRAGAFEFYRSYCEKYLVYAVRALGQGVTAVKTDSNRKFDAMSIAPDQGVVFYGNKFKDH